MKDGIVSDGTTLMLKLLGSPMSLFLDLRRLMNSLGYANYTASHTHSLCVFLQVQLCES